MIKVFYNPDTLEIKGFSDSDNSFDLPFIETEHDVRLLKNFKIKENQVVPIRQSFTQEDWDNLIKKE
jgi:hypothetical protein